VFGGVFKSGRFAAGVAFALHLFECVQLQKVAGYRVDISGHYWRPAANWVSSVTHSPGVPSVHSGR